MAMLRNTSANEGLLCRESSWMTEMNLLVNDDEVEIGEKLEDLH